MADSPFAARLKAALRADGPMRLDRFMAACNAQYYATRDPFGAAGDFTTAPEISQAFGELIGLWVASLWQAMGSPEEFVLAELGPGRGTLMADLFRAARQVPGFLDAARPHLVETSPILRRAQEKAVPHAAWHDTAATLPDGPAIIIANEFFDALPVRQFVRRGEAWAEIWVDEHFAPTEEPVAPPPTVPDNTRQGDVVEFAPARLELMGELAKRLSRQGGAALLIDYGYTRPAPGSTLQAVRAHAPVDPFATPGQADLTAHVDFAALALAARRGGAVVHGPVPQADFLAALGLAQRTEALARANPDLAEDLHEAARRLTASSEMGLLFKAMALCHPQLPDPPGFA
jgi:SAM-dependent MidA family methyltransferase